MRIIGWETGEHSFVAGLLTYRASFRPVSRISRPHLGFGIDPLCPIHRLVDELAGELFGDVEYGKSFYEHALCHSRAPCLAANHRMRHQGKTN
jgi:hypothetical protein